MQLPIFCARMTLMLLQQLLTQIRFKMMRNWIWKKIHVLKICHHKKSSFQCEFYDNVCLLSGGFTAQKMKFSIKDFFSKCDQIIVDLATFTEEISNGKLHFFVQCLKRHVTRNHISSKNFGNFIFRLSWIRIYLEFSPHSRNETGTTNFKEFLLESYSKICSRQMLTWYYPESRA